ncbi:MAG: hypothetical protein Q8942_15195 [Bacillota bacterium]|nr:hypothetical protein [Bacillota bacterium]
MYRSFGANCSKSSTTKIERELSMCYYYDIRGIIVPGKKIGDFLIRSTYNDILSKNLIERDYSNKNWPECDIHEKRKNIVLFLNGNNIIQEIVARNNYKGKVNGIFGIGDCLSNFKDQIKYETSICDGQGYFYFASMPGVRVLNQEWDEEGTSPIESIHVYDIDLGSIL